MPDTTCPLDGKPIPDTAYICPDCQKQLTHDLTRAAELWPHLIATAHRQTRVTPTPRTSRPRQPGTGPACTWCDHPSCHAIRQTRTAARDEPANGRDDTPLPFDIAASETAWIAAHTINAWAAYTEHARGGTWSNNTQAQLHYIAAHTHWLAHQPDAEQAFDELTRATRLIHGGIAQPRDVVYVGPCDTCGADMYADLHAPTVDCPTCRLTYDVNARRDWLLAAVEDQLERAADLARALTALGVDITRHRIATWETRGIITRHSTDPKGRPLYRIGDILNALQTHTNTA